MHILVPHVLHTADTHHPWKVTPIERLKVCGHTPKGVRVAVGTLAGATGRPGQQVINRPDHCVVCLPDEHAWAEAQVVHGAYQAALDQLAQVLRALGRYCDKLSEHGEDAPNPLTPTIVHLYHPPDRLYASQYVWDGKVPELFRHTTIRHTAKMVFFDISPYAQTHCYLCPDDAAWEQMHTLHSAAQDARARWLQFIERLGTYGEAREDMRYTVSTLI